VTACPSCRSCFCLFAAVFLDLLEFGLGELAWHVVAGHLGALHVVPDVLDDLGVGQGSDVPGVAKLETDAITRRMIFPERVTRTGAAPARQAAARSRSIAFAR